MVDVGYARVSSVGQSLDLQEDALTQAGCSKIFKEKKSGRRAADREELNAALDYVREGDTLVVTRLDRLARSVIDLHKLVETLTAKGVGFRVLQQSGIDTTSSTGKLTLGILAAVAEFEADIRAERQRDGIAAAKAKGVYRGRKPSVDPAEVKRLLAEGTRPVDVAKQLGCARSTVYRLAAEENEGTALEA
ncbi:recombinase family protein [Qipengyuania qiaonensis]|uniref:Recombinase family protein n=1 Tax=Qipengyuania qiaonensis TaxID=2867240 RepID=A0ABS7J6P9_9SPHN|nr:recombinase family protein [Qipengyuania qiaonensis]MBX7482961.1 recombinase family protein [Qipengyuania qiaonensis]